MDFGTRLCIESERIRIFSGNEKATSFSAGEGAAGFLRLSLDDINFLYNDVITSAIGVSKGEADKYVLWASRKLAAVERECYYMSYYNNVLKDAVYSYLKTGRFLDAKKYKQAIPELFGKELLEYVNSELDNESRDTILESFTNRRTFDIMTEAQKSENIKALMQFLYFRDAILFNIKTLRRSVKATVKRLANGEAAFDEKSSFTYQSKCAYSERSGVFCEIIEVDKPSLLADIDLARLVNNGGTLKICANCGSYFLPISRADSIYCRYIDKVTGKNCHQTGASARQREKTERNPGHREYNRAYKKYFARVRAGRMSETEFETWKEAARKLRDEYDAGGVELVELIEFFDKNL